MPSRAESCSIRIFSKPFGSLKRVIRPSVLLFSHSIESPTADKNTRETILTQVSFYEAKCQIPCSGIMGVNVSPYPSEPGRRFPQYLANRDANCAKEKPRREIMFLVQTSNKTRRTSEPILADGNVGQSNFPQTW